MTGYVPIQSDPELIWSYLQTVKGTIAFDIGANGGLVSRKLAERFETVIAVEPAIESYSHLIDNIPENVKALNVAVSDKVGTIKLRETAFTAQWGELFTDDTLPWGEHVGYRDIPAVTLDDLAEEYGQPDFIKIDTEGHEVKILSGGYDVLAQDPAFIIEIHSAEKGARVREILELFDLPYMVRDHEYYGSGNPARLQHHWVVSAAKRLR